MGDDRSTLELAVGPFLGSLVGVLGALFIFYLQTRRSRAEEQSRRDRELVGLLVLVYSELSMNRELLKQYGKNWRLFWSFPEQPTSSIWDEAKVRVVALAPPRVSTGLIAYYRLLQALLVYVDYDPDNLNEDTFVDFLKDLREAGGIVEGYVESEIALYDRKYGENLLHELPDRNPIE